MLPAWAAVFNRMVNEADPDPVLLGYSMGARLGLHALIDEAASWKRAVLVSAHPGLERRDERDARRVNDDRWLRRFDQLDWPEFQAAWNDQGVLAPSVNLVKAQRHEAMRRGLETWSLAGQRNLRPHLRRIQCPTLWVTGGRDPKFTGFGSAAAASTPSIRHRVVESAGHRVPWDEPDEFAGLVRDFLGL
jgi:2-succinyl-6-hydroxy-2,4-cyclohexadiene-1-carboxylate synthase